MDPTIDPSVWNMLFGPGATPPPMPAPLPVPTVDPATGMPMMPRPVEPYMTDPLATGGQPVPMPMPRPQMTGQPTSLGAALEPGNPTGYDTNPWSKGGALGGGATPATPGGSSVLNSLRGVQMPAPPTPQKVSTPHAPQLAKIQGGGVADLLASLGIGPQQAFPGLKLPSTLGQALGGR